MHKITSKNYRDVLNRLIDFIEAAPKESQRLFCVDLNTLFDVWLADDTFGTESQLDPRGDQRG